MPCSTLSLKAMSGNHIVLSHKAKDGKNVEKKTDKRVLTGYVKDDSGEPLIGANVHIKGDAQGTITDANGFFRLQGDYDSSTRLEISYIGMEAKEFAVGSQSNFDIVLRDNAEQLLNAAMQNEQATMPSNSKKWLW